ncbi:uncharacterized protein B0P05DRAFT_521289 [Gilbertella persicaria]|uniref:uncharacterized protein n=1 Tax=Gilbertella persicaria TaxID=101096 RepID=UPI00221F475D|nr:uncharacterized protein B0P05DRAFT_521289 [Gilbertella persicaria]KAI8098299.1 hypothetical protein B0P05DRAFT_521289 [Gilbertella persicaria]
MAIDMMQDNQISSINNSEASSTGTTRTFAKNTNIQRNETVKNMEKEILRILTWENPVRSGIIMITLVGFILLTHRHSLLQIVFGILTFMSAICLAWVQLVKFYQTIIADRSTVTNPFSPLLERQSLNAFSKENVVHYATVVAEVGDALFHALVRIILVRDTKKSVKWLVVFFTIYQISAYVASRILIPFFIISAFIVPCLYLSNKHLVDARLQQMQAIFNAWFDHFYRLVQEQLMSLKRKSTTNPVQKVD